MEHNTIKTTKDTALLLLLLLMTVASVAHAQFNYETNNGTITFTGYASPGGDIVIPRPNNDLPVTSIGINAFYSKASVTWASGTVVVVEACTSPANPIWSPLATNTLTADTSFFSDAQWTNYPSRFYRIRSP